MKTASTNRLTRGNPSADIHTAMEFRFPSRQVFGSIFRFPVGYLPAMSANPHTSHTIKVMRSFLLLDNE